METTKPLASGTVPHQSHTTYSVIKQYDYIMKENLIKHHDATQKYNAAKNKLDRILLQIEKLKTDAVYDKISKDSELSHSKAIGNLIYGNAIEYDEKPV